MKIEDNFLDQENFDKLQKIMMGSTFFWFYSDSIDDPIVMAHDTDNFQFAHQFYLDCAPSSPNMGILDPILNKINPVSIVRIKANLLTRTSSIIENSFHIDIGNLNDFPEKLKQWTTAIFYMNTNNGYTKFEDGTIVESVANRFVSFPSNMKHTGTSCTDEKRRIVINFNYYSKI